MSMRTQLLTNPSCEINTAGWSSVNGSVLSSSADRAWVGTKSQKVVYDGNVRTFEQTGTSIDAYSFTAGVTYTYSAYVWVPTGMPAVKIKYGGPTFNFTGETSTLNDQWERISVTMTAASTNSAWLYILNAANSVPNATGFYVDGAMLEANGSPALGTYFDGDTVLAGYVIGWSSTAHASTSIAWEIPPDTLLLDIFNRANSATVVGAPNIGPTPTIGLNAMGITSGQLYCSTAVGHVNWDLGTPNAELSCQMYGISGSVGVGLVLGWGGTSTSDYIMAFARTDGVWLYRNTPAGFLQLTTVARTIPSNGSVLRIHHRDRFVRVYVDDVLIIRWGLDYPMTATLHGVRLANTTQRVDNLLGLPAPIIDEDSSGEIPADELAYAGGQAGIPSAYVYKGRDTKIQDNLPGA